MEGYLFITIQALVCVGLTALLRYKLKNRELITRDKILIGVLYGICAILATHCASGDEMMVLNVRDLAPMCAGLFFSPAAGIIAGLMGGAERFIAGTWFGIGEYTTLACSIATCMAGLVSAFLSRYFFRTEKLSLVHAFFFGAAIEVFHMYMIFLLHRDDMWMAFEVVSMISIPMIAYCAFGLALAASIVSRIDGEGFFQTRLPKKERPVSARFQSWLFLVTVIVVAVSFAFGFTLQSRYAVESAKSELTATVEEIKKDYETLAPLGGDVSKLTYNIDNYGSFVIFDKSGKPVAGDFFFGPVFADEGGEDPVVRENMIRAGEAMIALGREHKKDVVFEDDILRAPSVCLASDIDEDTTVIVAMTKSAIYASRDRAAYMSMMNNILLFMVLFILIALMVKRLVVDKLDRVNRSLHKITDGDLNEVVSVYDSSEFTQLSEDINQTVDVLKGYIDAAEKRMEQELILARTIQASALPRNFFSDRKEFEIYATMNPAKEVGGDFFDFFFVQGDRLAVVIADVSGKGIPASLLMMRSKTAIHSLAENGESPAEIFRKVNEELCIDNEASMFVTAWIGIIDLRTGLMQCANAGHEYPALKRAEGPFEIYKDKHRMPLGAMEGIPYTEYELQLEPGDALYVYTDGVVEATNPDLEQYGTDRMIEALNSCTGASMKELLEHLHVDVHTFSGEAEQFDDETMVGFKYNGA